MGSRGRFEKKKKKRRQARRILQDRRNNWCLLRWLAKGDLSLLHL
jgi:hypothetical protein